MKNLSFSGRRALLLGGSCSLALRLAEFLIEVDLFPILTYRNADGARRIAQALMGRPGAYQAVHFDLGEETSLDSLIACVGKDLDYGVDFAQGDLQSLVASVDEARMQVYFRQNVISRAKVLKRIARVMMGNRSGRLVYVSSAAALRPNPGQGFYAAAKLAAEALYRSVGLELGPRGVTSVILRPGYIAAGRGETYLRDRDGEVLQHIPIRRALTVDEVCDTILFLLSDGARGINAVDLVLDGGLTAGKNPSPLQKGIPWRS